MALTPEELEKLRRDLGQGVTPGSGVGFVERLGLGFMTRPEDRESFLRQRGFEPVRLPGGDLGVEEQGRVRRVDPQTLDLGDVADFAGDIPATLLGTLGAIGGSFAGPVAGTVAGGAVGSAAGEALRQGIGNKLLGRDFTEELQGGPILMEGALGAAGEVGGRLLSKPFRGLFTKRGPRTQNLLEDVNQFDTRFNTDIEQALPPESRTNSPTAGRFFQGLRESAGSADRMFDADEELARRLETGLDEIKRQGGAAGPEGSAGPFNLEIDRSDLAGQVRGATGETLNRRTQVVGDAYDELRQVVDFKSPIEKPETLQAIEQVKQSALMKTPRAKAGSAQRQKLTEWIDDLQGAETFEEMDALRELIQDDISNFDPAFLTSGLESQLKKLLGGMRRDVEGFLDNSGAGELAQRAKSLARDRFTIDESSTKRLLRDPLKTANIPDQLRTLNADEIQALKTQIGALPSANGLPLTPEGEAAWNAIGAEVFDNIKQAAKERSVNTTRDVFGLSGPKLASELDRYKEGALREIFGPEIEQSLFQLADIAKRGQVGQLFANKSNTTIAARNPTQRIFELMTSPVRAGAEVFGQMAAENALGRLATNRTGQKLLLGELPFQQALNSNLLRNLGRLGSQSGIRQIPAIEDTKRNLR